MIYFDNSATTLKKPPEVAEATLYAINNFGNAGRSFYDASAASGREIYATRVEIAKLIGSDEPLNVAFTSSATESLNLVIAGLVHESDHVISTVLEHNSVLRPLYLSGCELSFMDCDELGNLDIGSLKKLVNAKTKFLVCTHGSNVTGNITAVRSLYEFCRANKILMILDIAQTFGLAHVDVDMADIFCFTGHKSLFGPQGTAGIITTRNFDFDIIKTGGAGHGSFKRFQLKNMPDVFEVGTLNSHSLYGLQKGVRYVNQLGVRKILEKTTNLMNLFYNGIVGLEGIKIHGVFSENIRLPIVSLSVSNLTSSELAERLYKDYGIATRPGIHCAPLLHKRLNTADTGLVRFSFSYFNNEDEIEVGISALRDIAHG